jgi:hypothetical protein
MGVEDDGGVYECQAESAAFEREGTRIGRLGTRSERAEQFFRSCEHLKRSVYHARPDVTRRAA